VMLSLSVSAPGKLKSFFTAVGIELKVTSLIPAAVKQTFPLARCGYNQRQHHKRSKHSYSSTI
jgi:hypothetical protein